MSESVDGLNIKEGGVYVDVTFGGGGHSKEILKRLEKGRLIAFDQDKDALTNKIDDERFELIEQNFKYLKNYLKMFGLKQVDGILADLGVSSHQFDVGERGFSIRFDGPLDMRMNQNSSVSAKDVVNTYEEEELIRVFKTYGEIKMAYKMAGAITRYREEESIDTTFKLIEAVEECLPKKLRNKLLAQLFQSLRIEVNDEMKVLKDFLLQSSELLKKGGRLVVITYHSLEDRLVKNFIKAGNFEGKIEKDFYGNPLVEFKMINRKPIIASDEEVSDNNRARSAKLRIAEKN